MRDVILSIDQGTTGSTALFLDATANCNVQVLSTHNVEFPNHYPQPGFVEHDVADIWTMNDLKYCSYPTHMLLTNFLQHTCRDTRYGFPKRIFPFYSVNIVLHCDV